MKSFLYGIFFGAAAAYLVVTQGAFMEATFGSVMSWRDSAKSSVYGYGGNRAVKR